jgi:uncharacterized membrane protein YidH (DUF202 family)
MARAGGFERAAQLERTVLAWNRSALVLVANGALIAKIGFARDLVPAIVAGFVVAGLGAAAWLLSFGRAPSTSGPESRYLIAGRRSLVPPAAVVVLVVSLVDLVLAAT